MSDHVFFRKLAGRPFSGSPLLFLSYLHFFETRGPLRFGTARTFFRKKTAFSVFSVYFSFRFLYNGTMKIWAKLITDGKIQKQFVYEKQERLTYSRFFDYLSDICHELDIPTPVLLKTHIFNFAKFNHVKFIPRDFVESLDYDQLFLENIIL